MSECLWLVRCGVPFDVAFSLSEAERLGWVVITGEQEGNGKFNWSSMKWDRPT